MSQKTKVMEVAGSEEFRAGLDSEGSSEASVFTDSFPSLLLYDKGKYDSE